MTLLTDSLGKKISLIIILSIFSIGFLMLVSFSFFGKIGQIGNVVKSAYVYEVSIGTAKYEFEKYVATGDTAHLDQFRRTLTYINTTDGTIGSIYRLMARDGMSAEEAVAAFRKTRDATEGQAAVGGLVKTLMGNPLLENLVRVTDRAHAMSTRWGELVATYLDAPDGERKKDLAGEIDVIVVKLPAMLEEFHGAMASIADSLSSTIKRIFLIIGCVTVVLIIGIALAITRSITKPLRLTVDHVREIARGNFLNTLEIKNRDELGIMVRAMNEMSQGLKAMVQDIMKSVSTLNESAGDLSAHSDLLSANAASNADKSNIVAAAAEEMSANMTSVSAAMGQSAQNTDNVVAAVEQMTATINEIAKNTETAKTIAENAVGKAGDAARQMARLDNAANAIGQVTETIREISSQTDLLSLNATIEAARAGEAGKGFAVVANEIKELAKQTSEATLDIQAQVDGIQETASGSVAVIEGISTIVSEVSQIVNTIASAIEEQSIATREIAGNTSTVAQGIEAANHQVGQGSDTARSITESIHQVHGASDEMNQASSRIKAYAAELSELAKTLGSRMAQFRI